MSEVTPVHEIKRCCAAFYQSDLVHTLLGDVLHPGGLALTHHLGICLGLKETDRVLDLACGRGASAVHLAESLGCRVTGLDYGSQNIATARAYAVDRGVDHLVTFRQGDAERLPFDDGALDGIISECSFCTFPEKAMVAAEMARVLCPGGRLGLTDMTVEGDLPDDARSLLAWVACVAGAGRPEDYVKTLREAGFAHFAIEDQRDALLEIVNGLRRKLLGIELAIGLGKLEISSLDLTEAKRLARRTVGLIQDHIVGYTLITAVLPEIAPFDLSSELE